MIKGAQSAATALFQIPVGLLSERIGERALLASGTILAGLAFVLLAFCSSFIALLVVLFVAGVGLAVQHPLCSSLISRAYRVSGRRGALGTYNFAGDVGKFLIAGSASLLIAAGIAWQAPAVGVGMGAIMAAIVFFLILRRIDIGGRPQAASDNGNLESKGWGITDRSGFVALCLIAIIDNSTRAGILTFVTFLMIDKGVSEAWAVQAIPAVIAGGMAGKLACGFIADKIGVIRTVIITELATAVGIVLILVLPDVAAFIVLPLLGVALNGTSSVLYGTIGDLVEADKQSRVFALFYTLTAVATVIAPLGFGIIGDWTGVYTAILISAGTVLLTIPLSVVLRPAVAQNHPAVR
jgi:MFS family permease